MRASFPLLLILALLLAASPTAAQEQAAEPAKPLPALGQESIMLTKSELDALDRALAKQPHAPVGALHPGAAQDEGLAQKPDAAALPDVALSALIWRGASDWTAWINGAVFSPGSVSGRLRAVDATSRHVDIEIEQPDRPPVLVRLQPGQIFHGVSGTISEGYRR
jgi:hypothetical protein